MPPRHRQKRSFSNVVHLLWSNSITQKVERCSNYCIIEKRKHFLEAARLEVAMQPLQSLLKRIYSRIFPERWAYFSLTQARVLVVHGENDLDASRFVG